MLLPTKPKETFDGYPWPEIFATVYDPIEMLTFVAGRTGKVKLGTSVMSALFQNPVTLARRFATLDRLSDGRAIAGIGQGDFRDEFEAANVPIRRRGRGFEEFVKAMRAVWGPDPVSFTGDFYNIPESRIGPKPVQHRRHSNATGRLRSLITRAGSKNCRRDHAGYGKKHHY
jgi:alkanesulfonate monooxygenase SsuD/methylene tetrahydromethanopterin reductase-like flavin-dependent oxidoreductase (luciferase family)